MISSTAEYAVRAAVHLATHAGASCTAREIAEATKSPPGYVSKVLQDLTRAGLATSQRGPNGGFALSRNASEISLLQVVNAVDPLERIAACPLGLPSHKNLCKLHRRLDDAIAMIENAFASTMLSDLVEQATAEDCSDSCGCPGSQALVQVTSPLSPK